MRILLINPPYQTLTSKVGVGHQLPLGLLMVGGALIRAGHQVALLDAECRRLNMNQICDCISNSEPEIIMSGHAGSTPAHPVTMAMFRQVKDRFPNIVTVYGGVYPTHQFAQVLSDEPAVDLIIRGEGEQTAVHLIEALAEVRMNLQNWESSPKFLHGKVAGVAYRDEEGAVIKSPDAPLIENLDHYPVGWELIEDWDRYQCFGMGRAAIIQFSRGCPHRCTYCGQFGFWKKWRYRDPVALVDEIEMLYRKFDVRFITLADENPTTLKSEWKRFLQELAGRRLPVKLFATIRAGDIVRDEDILDLYRRAGLLYVLMGIESTDDGVLEKINKKSTSLSDYRACQLLRHNQIYSILGHIIGLRDERWSDFARARRTLAAYDGDYLNAMYVTPHPWTAFGRECATREVVEDRLEKWDYRHQVLSQPHFRPLQLILAVKWLELCFHLRPRRLTRMIFEKERYRRQQFRWNLLHTGVVWLGEVGGYLLNCLRKVEKQTVATVYAAKKGKPVIHISGIKSTAPVTSMPVRFQQTGSGTGLPEIHPVPGGQSSG